MLPIPSVLPTSFWSVSPSSRWGNERYSKSSNGGEDNPLDLTNWAGVDRQSTPSGGTGHQTVPTNAIGNDALTPSSSQLFSDSPTHDAPVQLAQALFPLLF